MNPVIAIPQNDSASLHWGFEYPDLSSSPTSSKIWLSLRGRQGDLPRWTDAVVARLTELVALPLDPRGSEPLNIHDVVDALDFLERVMRPDTLPPWIGRLNTGGVQLTWHAPGVEVEAVFDHKRGEREVIVEVGDNEWDAPVDEADSLFASVADRLVLTRG